MSVSLSFSTNAYQQVATDVLVLLATGGNNREHKELSRKLKARGFKGNWAETVIIPQVKGIAATFTAVIGLGEIENPDKQAEAVRRGMGKIVQDIRQHGLQTVAFVLPAGSMTVALAAAAYEGAWLASYRFTEFSSEQRQEEKNKMRSLLILGEKKQQAAIKTEIARRSVVLQGVDLARDLVNRPAGHMSPIALVHVAKKIKASSKNISLKTLNRSQASRAGLNAFLAVAKGSQAEPYVIHLAYKPIRRTAKTKKIFLVGKGITFDSGGLSLKPAEFMEDMKIDMAGAAAVLGVFSALAKLDLSCEVHGIIAACENMPSGTAYRPGDVLVAKNGKTIEVLNTDAEGRITLADALSYATLLKPDAIIDVATLTGAAMVGLGETIAALCGNNDALNQELLRAADHVGEGAAILPMPEEYQQQIKSKVADMTNTSTTRYGGAITAAIFLREFVGETAWAHLDIAGPAYATRSWLPYFTPGATGYGVRLLLQYLLALDSAIKKT